MHKMNKIAVCGIGVYVLCGLQYKNIDVTNYVIHTKKITDEMRICILADLHCRRFGEKQSRIIAIVNKMKPDLIIIPGDLFDIDRDYEISFELIDCLKEYPVYFTSGNHDNYISEIDQLRKRLEEKGVCVLENRGVTFGKGDSEIELFGLSDAGRKPGIEDVHEIFKTNMYRILISHRPDFTEYYKEMPCALILSGHVHGGQWRIPLIHKGIYAPQQGLFPKYYQGVYNLNGTHLIVSRGLASGNPLIPRLYNDPEICFVTLKPKEKQ